MCALAKLAKMAAVFLVMALALGEGPTRASPVSSKRLVEVVDLSAPVVSPDGRWVAYRAEQASIERNTYDSVWYVQALEGGVPPRRVGDGGVPLFDGGPGSVPELASWSPDSKFIYYRALLEDRIGVWRAAADGSGALAITHDAADVRDFSISQDGRRLRYRVKATREEIARAEQEEYDRGIHIDGSSPVGAPLFRSSFIDGKLRTQKYVDIWWGRDTLLSDTDDRWKEIDLATRALRDVAPAEVQPEEDTASGLPDLGVKPLIVLREPQGPRVALVTPMKDRAIKESHPGQTERYELSVLPHARSNKPVVCKEQACTGRPISSVRWRPGHPEVVFTVTDRKAGIAQSIFRWNVETGSVRPVVLSQGLLNGDRNDRHACGLSVSALVCVAAEPIRPPRMERIDIESGDRQVLFEPNVSLALDLANAITSQRLTLKGTDGQEFSAHLFEARGKGRMKRPLFINFYSCWGFLRGGSGDEWPLATLAEEGISTLCINAPPYRLDAISRFDVALSAVRAAVDLLGAEGRVDPQRIGMGGLSYGSETALWVAMRSNLLAAVSISSPSVTPLYYLLGSLKGEEWLGGVRKRWGIGSTSETPERWHRISPTHSLDKITAPVLFQMSEEEYVYGLDYTIPMVRRKLADLYVFPNEPHQKFQPRHKEAAYVRNLDWFRFWLLGAEDQSPEKKAQYDRWRSMRDASARTNN